MQAAQEPLRTATVRNKPPHRIRTRLPTEEERDRSFGQEAAVRTHGDEPAGSIQSQLRQLTNHR